MSTALEMVPEAERPALQRWINQVGAEEAGRILIWFARGVLAKAHPRHARGTLYGLSYPALLDLGQCLTAES